MKKRKFSAISNLVMFALSLLALAFGFILPHIPDLTPYVNIVRYLAAASVIAIGVILICESASLVLDKLASITTFFVALFMLVMSFFSLDIEDNLDFYGIFLKPEAEWIFPFFRSLGYILSLFWIWLFYEQGYFPPLKKKERVIIYACFLITMVAGGTCAVFNQEMVMSELSFPLLLYMLYRVRREIDKKEVNQIPYLAYGLFSLLFSAEFIQGLDVLTEDSIFRTDGITSLLLMISVTDFIEIYCYYLFIATRSAVKETEQAQKVKYLQQSILQNQMSPHFILNSLQMVKNLYMKGRDAGDKGIDLISKIFRDYVDSERKPLVDISDELDNVERYMELQELRTGWKTEVIFNVETYDFLVPTFSIEPLVENAIKYSKVGEKKDGRIEIATREEEENYIVEVIDNGIGFDKDHTRIGGVGIANVRERLGMLEKGTMTIESKIGKGTKITMIIPKKGAEENETDGD